MDNLSSTIGQAKSKTDEPLSKTKRKNLMNELQDLGVTLSKLSKAKLAKLDLPEDLYDALVLTTKITSNEGIRRHRQYIGRLIRNVDLELIKQQLLAISPNSAEANRLLHSCEKWRQELINEDKALDKFLDSYPCKDITELRNLIRASRKNSTNLEHNQSYKKLFQFIKQHIGDLDE